MNLGDIKTAVKRSFGDESGAQITDADITRWANDGQVHIVRNTECLEKSVTTPTVVGTANYDFGDWIKLRRLTMGGRKLNRIELEELDQQAADRQVENRQGTPTLYYAFAGEIYLHPVPATVEDLVAYTVPMPATLAADGDTPEIPVQYHEELVRYALARAKELDEDWLAAGRLDSDLMSRISLTRENASEPLSDSYTSVRALPGDEGYVW